MSAWSQIYRTGQPPFLQRVHDELPQRDNALARFRLRLADLVVAVGTLANVHFAILKIDIGPPQAPQLRTAQTGEISP
jgi:hypothetical protein